jgi:hypothetical protein
MFYQSLFRFTINLRLVVLAILLSCGALPLHSQIEIDTLSPRVISSFEGTHFKVAFMQNEIETFNPKLLRIFMAAKKRANVVVTQPNGVVSTYTIQANSVQTLTVPNAFELRVSETAIPLSVDIRSDVPISVYALNSDDKTSDGFSSFPISFWDTSYRVISSPNDAYTFVPTLSAAENAFRTTIRPSQFLIIAAEDNTQITIVPKANTKGGMIANQQSTIFLNEGECYLVQSSSQVVGAGDLSGSLINSDKPIGVIGGHVRTAVPQFLGDRDSKDHLVEMMPPLNTWGNEYVSVPYIVLDQGGPAQGGDVFRVVTSEPNTILTIEYDNVQDAVFLPNAGDVYSRTTDRINFPTIWKADKPILVAQFMPSSNIKLSSSTNTDPFMIVLPPTEKFVSRILFQVPVNPPSNENQFVQHFIGIVADSLGMEFMRYDGILVKNINSTFKNQRILNSNYYHTTIAVTPGQHELVTSRGKFGGSLYGGGFADSYGITMGFSFGESIRTDSIRPRFVLKDSCGILFGSSFDLPFNNASGIDDYYQLLDSSFNISTSFNPVNDDTVQVLASVTNRLEDARLILDVYDRDGNGNRLRYFYISPKFRLPSAIPYGSISISDTTCRGFYMSNTGTIPIEIQSIEELLGTKFQLTSTFTFPITIPPGDSILIETCIVPNNETAPIPDSLVFDLGCGIVQKVGIDANLQTINLFSEGWNFGPVRIGDTVCAEAIIVNISSIPIEITELPCDICDKFDITIPNLPITLQPNDTLKIPVCFTPDSVRNYVQEHTVVNEFDVDSKFQITGRGIKPEIVVNPIDWQQRRVGTTNDSLLTFYNYGEAAAVVTYFEEIEPLTGSFVLPAVYSQSFTVNGLDSFVIQSSFVPPDTLEYIKTIRYTVDWRFHDTISVALNGEGTMPYIQTIDIDFGNIPEKSFKDSLATVVLAFGNENLTIDQFEFAIPNPLNPFEITDVLWQDGRVVPIGDSVQFTIRFEPPSVGAFEERVNVFHDANPNYARTVTQFVLRGVSVSLDTIDATNTIIAPAQFDVCSIDTVLVEFVNIGNAECVLESVEVEAQNGTVNFLAPIVPVTLSVNERYSFPVQVTNIFKNQPVFIKSIGNFRNILGTEFFERTDSIVIPVVSNVLTINPIPNRISVPGDTITLELSGKFSDKLNYIPEDLVVTIFLDFQVFRLNKNFVTIYFEKNGVETEISVPAVQTNDKISFSFPQYLSIFSGSIWKIQIPTLILLSDMKKEYPISVNFEGNSCTELINEMGLFSYDPICFGDFRNIGTDTTRSVIAIVKPNPVGNSLVFDAQIAKNTDFSVYLTNALGEVILLKDKINLIKGLYSLKFDVTAIANGTYVVHLISKEGEHFTYPILINK